MEQLHTVSQHPLFDSSHTRHRLCSRGDLRRCALGVSPFTTGRQDTVHSGHMDTGVEDSPGRADLLAVYVPRYHDLTELEELTVCTGQVQLGDETT